MPRRLMQGTIAVLAGAVAPLAAGAQGVAPNQVERGVTVQSRPRPDYDAEGMRLGSFRLDAAAEAGGGFDSNVYGRNTNVKSSPYATEAGVASLNSDWTTHALGASANIGAREYLSRKGLDWTDYGVGGFGRYDITPQSSVEGRYRHSQEHLDVYNFDVQAAGIVQPVPYSSDEVQLSGNTRVNRLGLIATGVYRTYQFQDITTNGVRSKISQNNFNTAIGAFGGSYALAPGRYVTAIMRLQDISYTNAVSTGRSSFTYEALLGFQYDFDGVWQGRAALGWRHRDYNSAAIKPLEGLAAEGALSWSPTRLTTVTASVARTIEESIRQNSASYTRTLGGLGVDHELRRNVILGASLGVENRAYQAPRQTATDLTFTVSARWLINRNLQLVGSYTHARRIQTSGGIAEFDRDVVEFRLRVML